MSACGRPAGVAPPALPPALPRPPESPESPVVPLVVAVLSVLLILFALVEVFEVMLLPRRVRRRLRFGRLYFRTGWRLWRALTEVTPRRSRHELLAAFGPLSMVGLLATWTLTFVTGFGCLQWALQQGHPEAPSLLNQLYFSGVTFFTLGYGDVTALTRAGKVVSVLEAGLGFGFIGVVIGYLPVLYQLFSRREAHVIRLDPRAGSPPTAVALLERHAGPQGLPALGGLLADWEEWSAEMLESHLSYPMLAYYRSQHDNESWLAALTAVIDASALIMAGLERAGPGGAGADGDDVPSFQARMTFASARLTIVEMARVLGDPHAPGADSAERRAHRDRLSPETFAEVQARLAAAGLRLRDPAAAAGALARARASYEPPLVALASRLAHPLPPFVRPLDARDNWEQHGMRQDDARGARALYEEAESLESAPRGRPAGA